MKRSPPHQARNGREECEERADWQGRLAWALALLALPGLAALALATPGEGSPGNQAPLPKRSCSAGAASTGGGFSLSGRAVPDGKVASGGFFGFAPVTAEKSLTAGCCPCSPTIFVDGFESGDLSEWSDSVGTPAP